MSDSSVQHLKTSPNESIKQLWKSTNQHTFSMMFIIQRKNILKEFHSIQEDKLNNVYLSGVVFLKRYQVSPFTVELAMVYSSIKSTLPSVI